MESGNTSTLQAPAQEQSPVESAANSLNNATGNLSDILGTLENRLKPVSEERPIKDEPKSDRLSCSSYMVESIRAQEERVNLMSDRVKHMMGCLQV